MASSSFRARPRRTRRTRRVRGSCVASAVGFAILFVGLRSGVASPAHADAPLVIWLSFDGVRHDYPDRDDFPALQRMASEGVRARRLIPVFPTSTFANHVSMATCASVDRHGIVGNRFFDPVLGEFDYENDGRFINAEPIWSSAERQGIRTASFFWVGSESPWRGTAATYRMSPFDSGIDEAQKVDQILAWIDLPVDERPGLVLSWWRGADRVGHRKGPDDSSVAAQLASQDAQLARLLTALDARNVWSFTTIVVSSDHGMTSGQIEIDVDAAMSEIRVDSRHYSDGAVTYLSLANPSDLPRAEKKLRTIDGHTVYRSDAVPMELRISSPGRLGDLVLVAEAPHYYARSGTFEKLLGWIARVAGYNRGTHGYVPDHPDMAGIFYVLGRGVAREARLDAVSNLDIAPTVSHLLGIEPPRDCEGKVLSAIAGGVE